MTIPLLDRIPIRRKVRFLILTACLASLCVMAALLFVLHCFTYERDYKETLMADAEAATSMCMEVINKDQLQFLGPILSAFETEPQISAVFVQLHENGKPIVEIGTSGAFSIGNSFPDGFQKAGADVIYVQALIQDGRRIGTLTFITNFHEDAERIHKLYASNLLLVLGGAFLLTMLIVFRLGRAISDPIDNLAKTARAIGARNDYSLRARKETSDELGECTDCFNLMLERIQNRDSALRYEIAERARAEEELQRAHQQFIEASRQEGMADVATCVLHNVGNVLNSVNVSATLVVENLNPARTENLVKAASLLLSQNGSLGAFLTDDPKGRLLPTYLSDLSEQLAKERNVAKAELNLLVKNIDHIKEIVSMQQRYARGFGVVQRLVVADLIEDALRMNSSALERHGVTVIRDFQTVPLVHVDKHKLLQIIVNLVGNARHALDDAAPLKKRITVSVRPVELGAFVQISVDDNGIGITEKNLARLFSHGFTTRASGHGFGLHNGAVSAKQMGGTLEVHSGGHMRGATFTLTLPVNAPHST